MKKSEHQNLKYLKNESTEKYPANTSTTTVCGCQAYNTYTGVCIRTSRNVCWFAPRRFLSAQKAIPPRAWQTATNFEATNPHGIETSKISKKTTPNIKYEVQLQSKYVKTTGTVLIAALVKITYWCKYRSSLPIWYEYMHLVYPYSRVPIEIYKGSVQGRPLCFKKGNKWTRVRNINNKQLVMQSRCRRICTATTITVAIQKNMSSVKQCQELD